MNARMMFVRGGADETKGAKQRNWHILAIKCRM